MAITVVPTGEACGAFIEGVDLTQELSKDEIRDIRKAWNEHHVIIFRNQPLTDDDLERVSEYFGDLAVDPFVKSIEGRKYMISIQREADETSPIFADIWHADWTFKADPPFATNLFSIEIPPEGGDTLFANQVKAAAEMPADLAERVKDKMAIHSAKMGYSKKGAYGDKFKSKSMEVVASDEALESETHPLVITHPESGKPSIYGSAIAYIVGIEGMKAKDGMDLVMEVQRYQTQEQFVYRHKWEKDMLVMWDNRSVLHKATGGFEGYRRELHRTTISFNEDKLYK